MEVRSLIRRLALAALVALPLAAAAQTQALKTTNGALDLSSIKSASGNLPISAIPQLDPPNHAIKAIDQRLVGKSAATDKALYSSQNHSTAVYDRNATHWLADVDLTCLSVWNSDGAAQKAGVAITPRHVLFANHFVIANGSTMRFVTSSGEVITRTLTAQSRIGTTDIQVGILDSDLPPSITPALVLPSNYASVMPLDAVPCITLDQEEKASVHDITTVSGGSVQIDDPTDATRLAFYEALVAGDSGNPFLILVDSRPVLVSIASTASNGPDIAAQFDAINTALAALGGSHQLTPVTLPSARPIAAWAAIADKPAFTNAATTTAAVLATSGQIPLVGGDGKIDGSLVTTGSTTWGSVTGKPFNVGGGFVFALTTAHRGIDLSSTNATEPLIYATSTANGTVAKFYQDFSGVGSEPVLHVQAWTGSTPLARFESSDGGALVVGNSSVLEWTDTSVLDEQRTKLGVPAVQVKTTTGDPAAPTGNEPTFVINTVDNNLKIYADGSWRILVTW